ncbi:MAG: hypothetical protein V4621_04890 [Pseudomonadota bacterium]
MTLLLLIVLLCTACNDTWHGMQKDSADIWGVTKVKANDMGRSIVE